MLAEESHRVVLGKLTDVDILQAVFRYVGKKMFQERTLARLSGTGDRDDGEILRGLGDDLLNGSFQIQTFIHKVYAISESDSKITYNF